MKKKLSYEEGMKELEALAHALEAGDMALEDSFEAYKRASELAKALRKLLDEGDRKIRVLTEQGEEEMGAEEIE